MQFYKFFLLLTLTSFSFASQTPTSTSPTPITTPKRTISLLTLAIEAAEENGTATWDKEYSTSSSRTSDASMIATPSSTASNSTNCSSTKLSTGFKTSPLTVEANRAKALSQESIDSQEQEHEIAMRKLQEAMERNRIEQLFLKSQQEKRQNDYTCHQVNTENQIDRIKQRLAKQSPQTKK